MYMKYIILILIVMAAYSSFSQKNYESEWKQVDSLARLGQPQSALKILDKIYLETRDQNNAPQFLKAAMYGMAIRSGFEEDYLKKAITSTEAGIATARPPVQNILQSVLAELYWNYYQSNRYTFLDRSETAGFIQDDISTWDLKKIVRECTRNYYLSIGNPGILQQVELGDFDALLLPSPETRKFRPTLYDFLAHRAIDFFSNSEAGLTQPAARFIVEKKEYFDPSGVFSSLLIESADTLSFEFNALRLMQQVIAFHLPDKDPSALVDADLGRLKFVHDHCILPDKDSLFLRAQIGRAHV